MLLGWVGAANGTHYYVWLADVLIARICRQRAVLWREISGQLKWILDLTDLGDRGTKTAVE